MPDNLRLTIEDDGVGIPDDAQSNRLSHGIVGMRQRVKALRGEFSIGRREEGGTRIQVAIPIALPGSDGLADSPVVTLP